MMVSTSPPMSKTRAECYTTLFEMIGLARADSDSNSLATPCNPRSKRLLTLLDKYLQDDEYGIAFRSMICYGRCGCYVNLELFNQHIILPSSGYEFELTPPNTSRLYQFREVDNDTQRRLHTGTLRAAYASVDFVLSDIKNRYPPSDNPIPERSTPAIWKNYILGKFDRSSMKILEVPSLQEMETRILKAISYSLDKRATIPNSFFFSSDSAMAWCPEEAGSDDYRATSLRACSEFPVYLASLLKDSPHDFLDEHAGVILPSQLYPEVEARIKKLMELSPAPHVDGIDLPKGREQPGTVAGTVIGIHQYLSPRFLAFYTVDHDASCPYMLDYRACNKKERKIRVSSTKHVNTKPVWLQFGEKSDVYLYLSQKASVGEEAWLRIANHLTGLLTDFVNGKIKECHHGHRIPKEHLLKPKVFTENVSTVGHPKDANYGPHDDGRNGTVSKDDPNFTRHLLMVVTFCLQNYADKTTRVAWCPKSEPSWVAGEIWQEFSLVHMQLLGVQESFRHNVNTNDNTVRNHLFYGFETDNYDDDGNKTSPGPTQGISSSLGDVDPLSNSTTRPSQGHSEASSNADSDDEEYKQSPSPLVFEMNLEDSDDEHHSDDVEYPGRAAAESKDLLDRKPIPKRIVSSARVCFPLQASGLKEILDDIESGLIKSSPKVYGKTKHYQYHNVWGATSSTHHRLVGTSTQDPNDNARNAKPCDFHHVFAIKEKKGAGSSPKLSRDLKKYEWKIRKTDRKYWPRSNFKKVASIKTASQVVTTPPVIDRLRDDGIVPSINHPKEKGMISIPFGPYLDDHAQPHVPGTCFHAAEAYRHYGMKLQHDYNEAWRSNVDALSSAFLRLPAKNSLPMDLPKEGRMSPYAEMLRIRDGGARLGFDIYRSGGNCVQKGQAPPAGGMSAGEGAFFEHVQSINNAYNSAIEIIEERMTPLAVFVGGALLPDAFLDERLKSRIAGAEQVLYLGTYTVQALGTEPGLLVDEIVSIKAEYADVYPGMDDGNFRFLLKPHRKYRLVPYDYPRRDGGYTTIEIDVRDNRRPLFDVPDNVSFDKAFGFDRELFDEDSKLGEWYHDGGLSQYIDSPFTSTKEVKRKGVGKDPFDWFVNTEEEKFESVGALSSFRLLRPADTGNATNILAEFKVNGITKEELWWIVMACSVASFLRLGQVNVDSTGHIGPLLDYDPEVHSSNSDLANYRKLFGNEGLVQYTSYLGIEIQRSPLTHPIRCYDPNRIFLLESTGGGMKRSERKGLGYLKTNLALCTDYLLQSILVEVLRVQILMEWSLYQDNSNTLPSIEHIPKFLIFLKAIRKENNWRVTSNFLQTQYEIHPSFHSSETFDRFFNYIAKELEPWLQRTVLIAEACQPGEDTFARCRLSLAQLLSGAEALGSSNEKLEFLCQHALMNLNEIVDEWPLGKPLEIIMGFGGKFGLSMLQRELNQKRVRNEPKKSKASMMNEILRFACARSDEELELAGLRRDDQVVVVAINGRPLCRIEPEHWGCIVYGNTERRPGRSRGCGNRYEVTSPHCAPVPNAPPPPKEASRAGKQFKNCVDNGGWRTLTQELRPVMTFPSRVGTDASVGKRRTGTGSSISPPKKRTAMSFIDIIMPSATSVRPSAPNPVSTPSESRSPMSSSSESSKSRAASKSGGLAPGQSPSSSASESKRHGAASTSKDRPLAEKDSILKKACTPAIEPRRSLRREMTGRLKSSDSSVSTTDIHTSSQYNLMIGMIFGAMKGSSKEIGKMKHTPQHLRDTARCLATESCRGRDCYTLDNSEVDWGRPDRHIFQSILYLDMTNELLKRIKGKVHQICLDYFWYQEGYWADRVFRPRLFQTSLPIMFDLLEPKGSIYFGLTADIFIQVAIHEDIFKHQFQISLVHENNVKEIDLVEGSHAIPDEEYKDSFGGKDQKPESVFGFRTNALYQKQVPGSDGKKIVNRYQQLLGSGDPLCYRFLKLTKLEGI